MSVNILQNNGTLTRYDGGGSSVDIVTSWESTLSDSKVPSEKLVKNSIPTTLSSLSADSTHRLVTDTEKITWNNSIRPVSQVSSISESSYAFSLSSYGSGVHYGTSFLCSCCTQNYEPMLFLITFNGYYHAVINNIVLADGYYPNVTFDGTTCIISIESGISGGSTQNILNFNLYKL